jgi:hypothetical protein
MDEGDSLSIRLLLNGGIVIAFVVMLLATLLRGRGFHVVALFALIAQGGCWHMIGEIGRATGGDDSFPYWRIFAAGGIVIIWAFILEWRSTNEWVRKRQEEKHRDSRGGPALNREF